MHFFSAQCWRLPFVGSVGSGLILLFSTPSFAYADLIFHDRFEQVGISPTPTGLLNDTGIDWCKNYDNNYLDCPVSSHPDQDGDHGRDVLARQGLLEKVGAGAAGFDYTKLDVNGNDLPASASDWSCVRDNHTGLIWETKVDEPSHLRHREHSYSWYNPDPDTNGGDTGMQDGGSCTDSDCDTLGFVQAVNAQGLCGDRQWRMPTRMELHSLTHQGQVFPAIDTDYFPEAMSWEHWSASSHAVSPDIAWGVDFFEGLGGYSLQKGFTLKIRLVSGGKSAAMMMPTNVWAIGPDSCNRDGLPRTTPSSDFTAIGDGSIVRHETTGLEWQRCAYGQTWDGTTCAGLATTRNWQDALAVADNAGDNWRLPNINELRSIVEECRTSPAINRMVFPDASSEGIWSASPSATYAGWAWIVFFGLGYDSWTYQIFDNGIRLVRGGE